VNARAISIFALLYCLIAHRIAKNTNTIDGNFHHITIEKRTYTFRRSGGDQVARHQSHKISDVAKDDIERENKITRVAGLSELAVNASFDGNSGPGIELIAAHDERADWAERIKTLTAGPLSVFFLQIAGGDVVHDCITENASTNVEIDGWTETTAANNDAEFAFVIHALGNARTNNNTARRKQRRRGLEKDEGLGGNVVTEFGGMSAVIAPDANDFSRGHRCEQMSPSKR
jgi:hypothetical protein